MGQEDDLTITPSRHIWTPRGCGVSLVSPWNCSSYEKVRMNFLISKTSSLCVWMKQMYPSLGFLDPLA